PHYKTASEVATLLFLHQRTAIPVPQVYYYDSSSDNELCFEWILMERVEGVALHQVWGRDDMGIQRMAGVVESVAGCVKQLQDIRFPAIGSLY
ncbi:hypothetical protein BJ508DRAFT_194255, partial [Ascobolus immersus RN42]